MELEEGIVYCELVTLEPLEEAADQGESVDDSGGRHLELLLLIIGEKWDHACTQWSNPLGLFSWF